MASPGAAVHVPPSGPSEPGSQSPADAAALSVELAHLAAGCNGVPHAAAWGPSGLVAYGAHHAVVICSPRDSKNLLSLPGQGSRVNCVEWIPRHHIPSAGLVTPAEELLLSGGSSGSLMLWSHCTATGKWSLQQALPSAHSGAVNCIGSTLLPTLHSLAVSSTLPFADPSANGSAPRGTPHTPTLGAALVVTASADCTVAVWAVTFPTNSPAAFTTTGQGSALPIIALGSSALSSSTSAGPAGASVPWACSLVLLQRIKLPRPAEAVSLSCPITAAPGREADAGAKTGSWAEAGAWAEDGAETGAVAGAGTEAGAEAGLGPSDSFPGEPVLLAVAGLTNHIQLFAWDPHEEEETKPNGPPGGTVPPALFTAVCQLRGHQDWIRGLDFSLPLPRQPGSAGKVALGQNRHAATQQGLPGIPQTTLLLASASQDKTIRLWRISEKEEEKEEERQPGKGLDASLASAQLSLEAYTVGPTFTTAGREWTARLDSLLIGHEDWVHSVRWHPPLNLQREGVPSEGLSSKGLPSGEGDNFSAKRTEEMPQVLPSGGLPSGGNSAGEGDEFSAKGTEEVSMAPGWVQPLRLLSTSMDRTMLTWHHDVASGLWLNDVSLGELAHSALGFFGGLWSPRGDAVLAHGFAGSFHFWVAKEKSKDDSNEGEASGGSQLAAANPGGGAEEWEAEPFVSGHFGAVVDLSWDCTGAVLLSASHDQTTRAITFWASIHGSQHVSKSNDNKQSSISNEPHASGRPSSNEPSTTASSIRDEPKTIASSGGEGGRLAFGALGWRETARPQVHGHDLHCCAFVPSICAPSLYGGEGGLDADTGQGQVGDPERGARLKGGSGPQGVPLVYASGAEEKVVRVFASPETFLETLRCAVTGGAVTGGAVTAGAETGGTVMEASVDFVEEGNSGARGAAGPREPRAIGASLPALGLSQKPIYVGQGDTLGDDTDSSPLGEYSDAPPPAHPLVLCAPPTETHLQQSTLWPETLKLYGHGNEVVCCTADHGGTLLATACKAQATEFADVWLWDCSTWKAHSRLRAHSLTVTQMEFSASDQFLLCVSRDRHVSVFERETATDGGGLPAYQLLWKGEGHKRIIWSGSWAPFLEVQGRDTVFATGSRDKSVKLWSIQPQGSSETQGHSQEAAGTEGSTEGAAGVAVLATISGCPAAVTAVAWSPLWPTAAVTVPPAKKPGTEATPPVAHTLATGADPVNNALKMIDESSGGVQNSPESGISLGDLHLNSRRGATSVLAVGMETGAIELWTVGMNLDIAGGSKVQSVDASHKQLLQGKHAVNSGIGSAAVRVSRVLQVDPLLCHVAIVQRLSWAPAGGRMSVGGRYQQVFQKDEAGEHELIYRSGTAQMPEARSLLASCSDDHSVRVFCVA